MADDADDTDDLDADDEPIVINCPHCDADREVDEHGKCTVCGGQISGDPPIP